MADGFVLAVSGCVVEFGDAKLLGVQFWVMDLDVLLSCRFKPLYLACQPVVRSRHIVEQFLKVSFSGMAPLRNGAAGSYVVARPKQPGLTATVSV